MERSVKIEKTRQYKESKLLELNNEFDRKTLSEWESIILRSSNYQKPVIINRDLIDVDPANTYVLPLMLAPGKHNFFIFTENKAYYNRYIGPCRTE